MFYMTIFPGTSVVVGNQLYTTPGNHSFVVPNYTELTVEVWAGGGSGGGLTPGTGNFAGQNGQNSYFYALTSLISGGGYGAPAANDAIGGGGGLLTNAETLLSETGAILLDENGEPFYIGDSEEGDAGGGYQNGTGGAAGGVPYGGGGTRLAPTADNSNGAAGFSYGGGGAGGRGVGLVNQRPGGGGGAYNRKTYYTGEVGAPVVGETINLYVGLGGAPGNGSIKGGGGANGAVRITWE